MLGLILYKGQRPLSNIVSLRERACLASGKAQNVLVMNIFPGKRSTEQVTKSPNKDLEHAWSWWRTLIIAVLI